MNKNLGRVIMPISRAITQEMGEVLRPFNLTPGERPFFLTLAQEGDGITQEALTVKVRVDKSSTARMIKSLEYKGFVERRQNPSDGRSNLIYLTQKSRDIYDDVISALTEYNRNFEKLFSVEEYDMVFCSLLKVDEYLQQRRDSRGKHKWRNNGDDWDEYTHNRKWNGRR